MKIKKICVLMSTYNGSKYLREQIESIICQKNVDVTIVVRDDGSKDDTLDIIKEYTKENEIRILNSDKNLGPGLSFMHLLYNSDESEYYAFADQDDIWKPEKLYVAVEMLEQQYEPALYCSNQILYCDGIEKRLRYDMDPNYSLANCICNNRISGCTMVFNKKLRDILLKYRPDDEIIKSRMHDTWVMIIASWCIG